MYSDSRLVGLETSCFGVGKIEKAPLLTIGSLTEQAGDSASGSQGGGVGRALWCHPTSALPSLPVVTEARAPWSPLRVGSVLPVAISSPPWGGTSRAFVIRSPGLS